MMLIYFYVDPEEGKKKEVKESKWNDLYQGMWWSH